MDLQAEPACWTKVWFAAPCCWDMFGSGVARQSGMLGRAASTVTLGCGRGTRAGKQKEKHQKLQVLQCRVHLFSFHEESETETIWLQQQEALLCVCASSARVSSALLSVTTVDILLGALQCD